MTYATRSAAGRSVPRRRARGLAVGAIAVTTLIAPVLLLAAVGALSTSLAAHSGGQGTRGLEMALRADSYGRYAGAGVPGWPDRLIDPVEPQDTALAAPDDVTGSVPVDAGACGGDRSLVSPMPTAGDLAYSIEHYLEAELWDTAAEAIEHIGADLMAGGAFVRLRGILASNEALARKLAELEAKYDDQFRVVFDAIRELMTPLTVDPNKRPIGFVPSE